MMRNLLFIYLLFLPLMALAQETDVNFSVTGGFYDCTFSVALSCSKPGCHIRYTTNGNAPTVASPEYRSPLQLGESLCSRSDIYKIRTCPDLLWYEPDSVRHCIVIRAAAFDAEGNRVSEVTTNSYFIRALGCDTHGLPVVSLCADSLDLFDFERGIMVPGVHCDTVNQYWTGNYYQKGRDWERDCNVEFYELDNEGVNQKAGLRMHGSSSREGQQKGMKLYARKEYGVNRFRHPFFKDIAINSFKRLALKPFAHRSASNALLGHVCSRMAEGLEIETLASRLVVVFLNGEYWGIYDLKEKPDQHFLNDHYGCNPDEVDMVESWYGEPSCGDNFGFIEMMRWLVKHDLSNEDNYQAFCGMIDVDSFIDYYCLELFAGNVDWPNNNMRCWKPRIGKWRWLFFDGDECLNGSDDMIALALVKDSLVTESTLMFNRLLSNQGFRDRFYGRFGQLMTHQFDFKTTSVYLQESLSKVEREIENQISRFGTPESMESFSQRMWYANHFLKYRTLNMAHALYCFYYRNKWGYSQSKVRSQRQFKYDNRKHSPTFLFRMARQFRDWRYVEIYFEYNSYHFKEKLRGLRLWRWLKR